jgi:hypothetical protein
MASGAASIECALCGSALAGSEPAGTCVTCAAGNDGNGNLCRACLESHGKLKPFKAHEFVKLSSTEESLLHSRGLAPAPAMCPAHPSKPIELMCTSPDCEGSRLCCSLCPHSGAHTGHEFVLIEDAARRARENIAQAVCATTAGVPAARPVTPLASLSDVPAAVARTPVVLAAQRGAVAAAEEIAVLEQRLAATQADIDALRDGILATCHTVHASLSGQLKAFGEGVGARLQAELAAWDGLHDRGTANTTVALEASTVLGPANAVHHMPALSEALASLRAEIEAKTRAPLLRGYVGITAAAAARIRELTQALRDAAEGAVTDKEDKVAPASPAATSAPLKQYNHAPAPAGPVYAAAQAGDVPALMRLLDGGASTEEKNGVSGTVRP